jgi:hypothetical protein
MPGQPNRRDKKRRDENRSKYRELVAMRDRWIKQGLVEHGIPPHEALQRIIDDSMLRYLEECAKNDGLRETGADVKDDREQRLRKDAAYFASLAIQYGLEERRVRVTEARTQLFQGALLHVVRHPDIGLDPSQVRKIPGLMKEYLDGLRAEGQLVTVRPRPDDIEGDEAA